MKLNMEAQKKHFKDHVAHFKDYGDIKVIDFYNPNSSAYRIRFVFDAGRELWRYYHSKPDANPNASFYDIKEYFQGRTKGGSMNKNSDDEQYMRLIRDLRQKMKILAKKIEPCVYEYGFLMK